MEYRRIILLVAEAAYDRLINYYRFKNNADSVLYYAKENLAFNYNTAPLLFAAGEVNIGTAYSKLWQMVITGKMLIVPISICNWL